MEQQHKCEHDLDWLGRHVRCELDHVGVEVGRRSSLRSAGGRHGVGFADDGGAHRCGAWHDRIAHAQRPVDRSRGRSQWRRFCLDELHREDRHYRSHRSLDKQQHAHRSDSVVRIAGPLRLMVSVRCREWGGDPAVETRPGYTEPHERMEHRYVSSCRHDHSGRCVLPPRTRARRGYPGEHRAMGALFNPRRPWRCWRRFESDRPVRCESGIRELQNRRVGPIDRRAAWRARSSAIL